MNPLQLQEMLNTGNPDQIAAVQTELQRLGLYKGRIDGSLGRYPKDSETVKALGQYQLQYTRQLERQVSEQDAAARERADQIKQQELELGRIRLQQQGTRGDAETEALKAETAAKQQYQKDASSGWGIGTQIATNTLSPLSGYVVGRTIGSGLNELANRSQSSKNTVLREAAEDRLSGITTRQGAREGTGRSGAMPSQNSALRVGGRMLPHMVTGAGMIGKGATMLAAQGEDQPFYPEMANRAAGLGLLGTGVGVLEQGANYAVNPGVAPDAKSISIMESNQLRRNAAANQSLPPDTPQSTPPGPPQSRPKLPGTRGDLMEQAKKYGVKGRSKMTVPQLRDAVADAIKNSTPPRGGTARKMLNRIMFPLGAAGLAYEMTPRSANAATGEAASDDEARALTNAGIAGGTAFGVSRLLPRGTMPLIGGAMGPIAAMTGPDFTAETEQFGRNAAVRDMPWLRHVAPIYSEAHERAQVPDRNPRSLPPGADPDVAKAWRKSPRRTIIELSRSSGLDAEDIATLAGVAPDEVASVMGAIPQRAMEMRASP